MRASLANGLALWGVLACAWFTLAALYQGVGAIGWALGGAAAVVLLCWRLGLLGGPAWPDRTAELAELVRRAAAAVPEGAVETARACLGDARAFRPSVVLYAMPEGEPARGSFAFAASLRPGLLATSIEAQGVFLHTLHEDDADEEELLRLQESAKAAGGP